MLYRRYLAVFVIMAACKAPGYHGATDAGAAPPGGADAAPDAPPATGGACDRVGFPEVPWVVTGHQPSFPVVADVNGDGIPDLIVVTQIDSTVSVLLGRGGGLFQPRVDHPIDSRNGLSSPVVADVNHDGKLDLIVASGDASVLLGNGDGTFQAQVNFPTGGAARNVTAGDVNGDGELDLVVSNSQVDHVSVLLGRGDGTFRTPVDYPSALRPGAVTIVDVNRDGHPDLVVVGISVSVLLGNGDGTFQPEVDYLPALGVSAVAVADLGGDGNLDLVAVTNTNEDFNLIVLFGNGDGTFPRRQDFESDRYPVAVAVADLDGDGNPDVITANYIDSEGVVLFGGSGGMPFAQRPPMRFRVGAFPSSMVVTDVSGDGRLDLVVANRYNVSVELGNGNGTFRDMPPPAGPAAFFFVADLNSDGKPDAVGPGTAASVEVQLGIGDGTFRAPVSYATDMAATLAVAADVNHDGKPDVVTLNDASSRGIASLSVLLGNGDGTFQARIDQPIAPGATAIATADLDRDGNADLIEVYSGGSFIRVVLGNGDGTFRTSADYPMEESPRQLAAADLDGDGTPDLAVIGPDTVSVRLGNGDGTFRPGVDYPTGLGASLLGVADVNGDGKLDLVVYLFNTDLDTTVRVMLGVGDGTFVPKANYPANEAPDSMVVADVTGDGKPDLVMYSELARTVSVLVGDGAGAFQPRVDFGAIGTLRTLAVVDVTSDGKPDILVSGGSLFVAACQP
jgi:hypothetical protein